MRWLITGGCGCIGTRLVELLADGSGHCVRVIDNFAAGSRDDLARVVRFQERKPGEIRPMTEMSGPVELIEGDVLDGPLMLKAAAGADVIVHLAASGGTDLAIEDPAQDCTVNVLGTLNALEAARQNKVPRFVFASSNAAVGECEPPAHEEIAPHPLSPFGASKLAGEGYCSAYYWTTGLDTVSLRFGELYGPGCGHDSNVVGRYVRKALAGEPIKIHGDGQQACDLIFIDDVVGALRQAAVTEGIGGETFLIAASAEPTIGTLIEKLVPVLAEFGIPRVDVRHAAPLVGDVQRSRSNVGKAREMLGWKAETTLSDGLRRTVAWFIEQARKTGTAA